PTTCSCGAPTTSAPSTGSPHTAGSELGWVGPRLATHCCAARSTKPTKTPPSGWPSLNVSLPARSTTADSSCSVLPGTPPVSLSPYCGPQPNPTPNPPPPQPLPPTSTRYSASKAPLPATTSAPSPRCAPPPTPPSFAAADHPPTH